MNIQNNNFEDFHAKSEAKAKADKEYYLNVWSSHIGQLLNLVSDVNNGLSYERFQELKAELENAASNTWEFNNGTKNEDETEADLESRDNETAKTLILVAELNIRQPHAYDYKKVVERINDLSRETGIDNAVLKAAYIETKRLIANHPGEQVNKLVSMFTGAVIEFFSSSDLVKGK